MIVQTKDVMTGAVLVSGISLLLAGSALHLEGAFSGQGSFVTHLQTVSDAPVLLKPAALQYAAVETVGKEFIAGMLLVLLGLAIHVFFLLRKPPRTVTGGVRVLEVLQISTFRNRSNHPRRQ
jgi:hypothetical protein